MVTPQNRRRIASGTIRYMIVVVGLCSALTSTALESLQSIETRGDMGVIADLWGPASSTEGATSTWPSSLVAEYAPVSIDSLPLYRPTPPERESWSAASSLTVVTRGVLSRGESLSTSLRRQGITSATIHLIASQLQSVFDFRQSRPGDRYRLAQDTDGMVLNFRYMVSSEKSHYMFWEEDRYEVRTESAELHAQLAKVSGRVDSSLYESLAELGEKAQLAGDIAEIFAWDIDFSRNVRPGDDFQILFERLYRKDEDGREVYVRPGQVLAARYRGSVGEYSAVFFAGEGGHGGYYRPDGRAIERAFLMAPLKFTRISSAFSTARHHPILKVVRPHRGIDYAAPRGTPIWSVADGKVIYRGWAGASGKLVKIRHANGYVSSYAHLSRFEAGVDLADRLSQKQVIGYVGQTGLATGPHVCFRIQREGHYVNPLDIASPAGNPISREDWSAFSARRDILLSQLGVATLLPAEEAL